MRVNTRMPECDKTERKPPNKKETLYRTIHRDLKDSERNNIYQN